MGRLLETLRSGAWVSRERMRLVALAVLVASLLGAGWLLATSDGLNDALGRPLGTDFSNVYAAGSYALDGQPTAPYNWPAQHFREKQIFGNKTPFYGWHYPPFFLLLATPLAMMPYPLALAVWQGTTFALYLWAIWAILVMGLGPSLPPKEGGRRAWNMRVGWRSIFRRFGQDHPATSRAATPLDPQPLASLATSPSQGVVKSSFWLLLACAYPAVFVNLGHGHNGFLTAALIGGALVQLDRRPLIAGVLFGLMAYKPQFGLLIPLVLVLTGRWRVIAAATVTVIVLAAVTTLCFGIDIWSAFLASTKLTRVIVLEHGDTGWYKIQSIFSWVRMWGGNIPLAYAIQTVATVTVAALLGWLWRSRIDFADKAAALAIGAILATPYSLDYDLMVLAPAIAFLAVRGLTQGFAPYERSMLAILWVVPLIARTFAHATLIPLAVPAMLATFALIVYRAAARSGVSIGWHFVSRALE